MNACFIGTLKLFYINFCCFFICLSAFVKCTCCNAGGHQLCTFYKYTEGNILIVIGRVYLDNYVVNMLNFQ